MSESDKIALVNGTATIPYRIIINGDVDNMLTEYDIVSTTYEDYRYVNTSTLCIGQFVARTFEGKLKNYNKNVLLEDTDIEVQMGVRVGENTTYYSLGNFLTTKQDDNDVNDTTSFKAMDYTKKFNKVFNAESLSFPCSALELAEETCRQCGVELATKDFANNDFVIENNQYTENDTCRKVMQDIGKLAYSWVRIGWDNKCYLDFSVIKKSRNMFDYENPDNYGKNKPSDIIKIEKGIRVINKVEGVYKWGCVFVNDIEKMLGKTITISCKTTPSGDNDAMIRVYWWNTNQDTYKTAIAVLGPTGGTFKVTEQKPDDADKIAIFFYSNVVKAPAGTYVDYQDIMMEFGNFVSPYEPYSPYTYSQYDIITNDNYYDLTKQKKIFGPVNRVVIGMSDIEGENAYVEDTESIEKNGVCELKIMDNNITYTPELRQKAITQATRLFGLTYLPLETNTTGHPWLDGLNPIRIIDMEGNNIDTYPYDRTIEYAGHIKTKLVSKADSTTETKYKNNGSFEKELRKTRIIVDKQNQVITSLASNVSEYDTRISKVEQNVDTITQTVNQKLDLIRTTEGKGTLSISNVSEGNLLSMKITGSIIPLFPSKNIHPSTDLYTLPAHHYIKIQNSTGEEKIVTLPFTTLLSKDDVYDVFEFKKDGTAILIKRLALDENGVLYQLEKEEIIVYDNMFVPVFDGDNTITFNYYTPNMVIEYAIKNDLTDVFATQVDSQSMIRQARNEIELSVTQDIESATDTDKLIAKINIKPGNIALEGTVTANDNFKILKDGSIVANNGSFRGNIYLEDGNKVIGGDGLLTNLQYISTGNLDDGFSWLGFEEVDHYQSYKYADVKVDCFIPKGFTPTEAYITLYTSGISVFTVDNQHVGNGICKNLKLYKGDSSYVREYYVAPSTGMITHYTEPYGTEIKKGLNNQDTFTPSNNVGVVNSVKSIDVSNQLTDGRNIFFVRTTLPRPASPESTNLDTTPYMNTGVGKMVLDIIGYMSFE